MESAERTLQLFDAYWFNHDILTNKTLKLGDISSDHQGFDQEPGAVTLSKLSSFYIRSSCSIDQYVPGSKHSNSFISSMSMISDQDQSPRSVLMTPRVFQRSLSGKEGDDQKQEEERKEGVKEGWSKKGFARRNKGGGGGRSKSLSELEFEELKGFMDLGFVFSEEDSEYSRLASILPGLQRLQRRRIKAGDHTLTNQNDGTRDQVINSTTTAGGAAAAAAEQEAKANNNIKRPYLSEAWGWGTYKTRDESKVENQMLLVINWRLPSLRNEADMKNHLRLWAHTVASTLVR